MQQDEMVQSHPEKIDLVLLATTEGSCSFAKISRLVRWG